MIARCLLPAKLKLTNARPLSPLVFPYAVLSLNILNFTATRAHTRNLNTALEAEREASRKLKRDNRKQINRVEVIECGQHESLRLPRSTYHGSARSDLSRVHCLAPVLKCWLCHFLWYSPPAYKSVVPDYFLLSILGRCLSASHVYVTRVYSPGSLYSKTARAGATNVQMALLAARASSGAHAHKLLGTRQVLCRSLCLFASGSREQFHNFVPSLISYLRGIHPAAPSYLSGMVIGSRGRLHLSGRPLGPSVMVFADYIEIFLPFVGLVIPR